VTVTFSKSAVADLMEIGDFIKPHNPARAGAFVAELYDCCLSLADRPRAYPLVPRYERYGIRRYVHQDYLIFYRIVEDSVEIIHILHGARNYEALLFKGEAE
jgi:toxin ParE1/3/4